MYPRRVAPHVRAPLVVALAITSASLVLLPFCRTALGPTLSFLPTVLAVVACLDLITLYLLSGEYRDTGDRRVLATAWAYLWSLVLMLGYALAFPGVFAADPPLGSVPSVAPYLYIGWHAGFPLILGLAWAPWPRSCDRVPPVLRRRRELVTTTAVVLVVAAAVVAVTVRRAADWPVLIVGLDTSGMLHLTAPVALPLVLASLLLTWRGLRGRTGPERWATVVVLVCLCDLTLTYTAGSRFSLGWYAGRTLTVVAASVVLVAMLASFRRMKADAEFHAAFDGLTGLANRRTAHVAVAGMVARAHRAGGSLSVVVLDLDHFKRVNDRLGHAAGDAVLAAVGAALAAGVRQGDVPARLGGEEFAVLAPDTDDHQAHLLAERLRVTLSGLQVPGVPDGVRASFGVASLGPEDLGSEGLLLRADRALYAAKAGGRDRVVSAVPPHLARSAGSSTPDGAPAPLRRVVEHVGGAPAAPTAAR